MLIDKNQRKQTQFVPQRSSSQVETNANPEKLFNYLKTCDALLFFIDPGRELAPGSADGVEAQPSSRDLIFRLLEDLRYDAEARKIQGVAFCLTKADSKNDLWLRRPTAAEPQGELLQPRPDECPLRLGASETERCKHCVIYERLGEEFMLQRLPGVFPREQAACFMLSAIGRKHDDSPNVSDLRSWERSRTPRPQLPLVSGPKQNISLRIPTGESSFPRSRSASSNEITPYGLLEPLLWLLEGIEQRRAYSNPAEPADWISSEYELPAIPNQPKGDSELPKPADKTPKSSPPWTNPERVDRQRRRSLTLRQNRRSRSFQN